MADHFLLDPSRQIDGVELVPVNAYNVGIVETLVRHNFPIQYPKNFYDRLVRLPSYSAISSIAFVKDVPVGCIVAFCEPIDDDKPGSHESTKLLNEPLSDALKLPGLDTLGNPYYKTVKIMPKATSKRGSKKAAVIRTPATKTVTPEFPDSRCYIAVLIVTPPFRGKGISKLLIHNLASSLAISNEQVKVDKTGKVVYPPSIGADGTEMAGYHPMKYACELRKNQIQLNRSGLISQIDIHVDIRSGVDKLYSKVGFGITEVLPNHYADASTQKRDLESDEAPLSTAYHMSLKVPVLTVLLKDKLKELSK